MKIGRIYQSPKTPKLEGILKSPLLDYPPIPIKEEGTSGEDHGVKVVKYFDETMKVSYEVVTQLRQHNISLQNQVNSGSQSIDFKIKDMEDELGTKPAELTQEFDALNVWSVVGNLAEIVV